MKNNPGELPRIEVVRRKRQRTMRIRVSEERIVVSGPATLSQKALMNFVREKQQWIQKSLDLQRRRTEKLAQKRKQVKGTLLLRGERKPIHNIRVPDAEKPGLSEEGKRIIHRYHTATPPEPGHDVIYSFYRHIAGKELTSRFDYWCGLLPFQPSKLTIRNQKTKWGSCSSRGTLSLNWRLIKCPTEIMDYIIIHELCHLRHLNHSRAFWDTVETYYPNVTSARKWIRKNSEEIFGDF